MNFNLLKFNRLVFLLLYLSTFIIIVYKVFNVPVTHDEVPTAVFFSDFSFWEIMMYPDPSPNNHILNTILTKCSVFIFGNHQWSIRLPNLLFFVIYAFGAYRILANVLKIESSLFIAGALLFIANPFLLDFFGLNRGYGISIALCTLSISYLISGFKAMNNKNIWFAFFLSMLACYANFSLLVFWAAISLISVYYFLLLRKVTSHSALKPILFLALFCLFYIALIAIPIHKMQSTNQFQYWTSLGFFEETIVSTVTNAFYGSRFFLFRFFDFFSYLAMAIITFNLAFSIRLLRKNNIKVKILSEPVFIASSIILLTAGINLIQTSVLGTPNLNGRTALFFYPLFITSFVTTISLLSDYKNGVIKKIVSITLIIFCLFHLIIATKLDSVREWSYDANTLEVIEFMNKDRNHRHTSLKTNWRFHPSFYYYNHLGNTPWLNLKYYDKAIDVNTDAQYYYVLEEDFELLKSNFKPIVKYENNCWLLRRR